MQTWFQELDTYTTDSNVIKIIVGNKCDKGVDGIREVTFKDGDQLARSMGTLFIETSAKTTAGVQQAFEEVVHKVSKLIDCGDARIMAGIPSTRFWTQFVSRCITRFHLLRVLM